MDETRLQAYYKIFTTYWLIFKKYAQVEFGPDYYRNLTNECDVTYHEFKQIDKQFTLDIFKATISALTRLKEGSGADA